MASIQDIGRELGTSRFRVDESKVMELARALFDDDPVYRDAAAARERGFAEIPVPLTASVLASHWDEGGAEGPALALGMDLERLLHGGTSWEFLRPLRVGDELIGTLSVTDVTSKTGSRGGTMTFVTLQVEYRDRGGSPVLRKTDTMIERGVA